MTPQQQQQQQQRASQRLAEFAALYKRAATLARYASLAVRIDAALLRRLRLSLMPGSDASAEADLWFGDLCESRGGGGFVLDGAVAGLLQQELREERLDDGRRALDAAYGEMQRVHARWPAALQLEEQLTYLALAGGDNSAQAISELLRPAMVAMASGGQRSVEVARWALRAMPRLPQVARENDAAVAMVLAAMAALGSSAASLAIGQDRPLPPDLGWLLPPSALSDATSLSCEVLPRAVVFRQPRPDDPLHAQLKLPLTRPLVLELRWTVGTTVSVRIVMVELDRAVELPDGRSDLQVRTLAGVTYRLDPAEHDPQVADTRELLRSCVEVRSGDAGAFGVLIAPGLVLTPRHVVTEPSRSADWVDVRQGGRSSKAEVVASDSRVELALLSLQTPIDDVLLMPWRDKVPAPGEPVWVLAHGEGGPTRDGVVYRGRVQMVDVTTTVAQRRFDGLLQLTLDDDAVATLRSGPSGAPVVIDGAMVGMVTMRGNMEVYATSAPLIARFLRWAQRPGEHYPDILLSYAPQDDYGKGQDLDERSLERVVQALQTAHLRRWDIPETGFDEKALVQLGDAVEGAVCLLTPVASGAGAAARRQLAIIAFRRWADPRFPVALATYRTSVPKLPLPLQDIPPLSLDALDDEALWQQLQDVLDNGDGARDVSPDEQAFVAHAFERLSAIAPQGTAFDASLRAAFTKDLRAASSMLPSWLGALPENQARPMVELAAMLALPGGEALATLRRAAEAAPGARVVQLGPMPEHYARLLLAKAWFPRPPPPHVVILDPHGATGESAGFVVDQVVRQISTQLDCTIEDMRWPLTHLSACYVVMIDARTLPGERVLYELRQALPGALLCFVGVDGPDDGTAARLGITTAVVASPDPEWVAGYERLMDLVIPTDEGQKAGGHANKGLPPNEAAFEGNDRVDSKKVEILRLVTTLHRLSVQRSAV